MNHATGPTCSCALYYTQAAKLHDISTLQDALKARDLEIKLLKEYCEDLKQSIEQQDAVIAQIYASEGLLEKNALLQEYALLRSPIELCQAPFMDKKTGEALMMKQDARIADTLRSSFMEDEKNSVLNSLFAMGFKDDRIQPLLEVLIQQQLAHVEAKNGQESLLNAALDQLMTVERMAPSSEIETLVDPTEKRRTVDSNALVLRKHENTMYEMGLSAGFLHRSDRKNSIRLSASDFGLLEEYNDNQQMLETSTDSESGRSSNQDYEDSPNTSSRSESELFSDEGKEISQANKMLAAEEVLTFKEVLCQLRQLNSRDLMFEIQSFTESTLNFLRSSLSTFSQKKYSLQLQCRSFFENMEVKLHQHSAWRHLDEVNMAKARDGIEKLIMDKLGKFAIHDMEECKQWKDHDRRLSRRMRILRFITPDMLDIRRSMQNEVVYSMAEDELRRINMVISPSDKLNCIVRCCSVIFSVLSLSRGHSKSQPGADDFLPVFIYIVLCSQIPHLYSNCEYISAYRNPTELMSRAGYCLVNLKSALEYLDIVDASMLSISEDEFAALYEIGVRQENEVILPSI